MCKFLNNANLRNDRCLLLAKKANPKMNKNGDTMHNSTAVF